MTLCSYSPPAHFRHSAHFSKHSVNMLNFINALSFKNTIRYAAPSIVQGELYFNAIFAHCNIGECLRMRIEINSEGLIIFCNIS